MPIFWKWVKFQYLIKKIVKSWKGMFRFRSLQKKVKLAIFFRNCTPLKYRGENSRGEKNHTEPKIWVPISRNFLSCPGKVYTWTAHLSTHQKCTHTPTLSKNELGGWATKFIALFIFYRLFWNGFFMRSFTAHFT